MSSILFPYAYAENNIEQYKQSRKVVVDTQKAELCFADTQDCHKVLIGKTTPKGVFPLTLYTTTKKGYGGEIIGFKEEKDFLYNSELSLSDRIFGEIFRFKGDIHTVKEGDMVGDFKVIDTPGHTIGSKSFYYEKDKILISGDTLFRRSYGRYDLPTGSLEMLCHSLEKLSKLPDETVVYNGHTDNTTIGEEKLFLARVGIL